ncbi:Pycsar system effector family protein [Aliarcobacter cryaerophilus]|uniref:Pycsar system effector family protein n=1 Tax=Aliarcobacter cryaerophilus TaxID=28198 RepID=UPI0021B4DA87|nr:Pycsar system effector family protein [Aliarcobacter cryaerophilus]MCT7493286.1 DUF5706 domain-containing protein [Aliarcobacter cryaerophilus]
MDNQENTKLIYSVLQDIFKNIWEQQKYSEVKNGIILTLNIAILTILTRIPINENFICKVTFFILIALFFIHIFLILQSFFPKNKNKENIKWTNDEINIFFFGDIQKLNSNKYLDILLDKYNINKNDLSIKILLDLANQIVKLSEIVEYKYTSFKNSIYRMYGLTILFSLYFTYLFFWN